MAEPIARVHVDEFDPEVYRGERALEYALAAAARFRGDFPGAIVGVSYNPAAAAEKKADIMSRLGLTESHGSCKRCGGTGTVNLGTRSDAEYHPCPDCKAHDSETGATS